MFWKKKFFYGVVVGCFALVSGLTPLWAADLIDILKSKDILNQQEADQLKKEAQGNASLPSALQGFKFSSTIFGEWNSRTYDHGSPSTNATASTNQFLLNRAYLTLTRDVNDWLGMNITADLFSSVDANDKANGYELRLKYGYVNLNYLGTTTQIGMVPTPSDTYDAS